MNDLPMNESAVGQVTGQLADKPTRGQSSRGLDNSPKCLI